MHTIVMNLGHKAWRLLSESHVSCFLPFMGILLLITYLPEVLYFILSLQINSRMTLFMIPNLWRQSEGSPFAAAASRLISLPHVCVSLRVRSMKQWYFPVTSNEFVRFLKATKTN